MDRLEKCQKTYRTIFFCEGGNRFSQKSSDSPYAEGNAWCRLYGKRFPDVSVHGERAWFLNRDNTSRLLGIMYCGAYAQKDDGTEDDFLYIGMNFHWEKRNIALPNLPEGMNWKKIADTSEMGEPRGSVNRRNHTKNLSRSIHERSWC